jgi:hypothetical protein
MGLQDNEQEQMDRGKPGRPLQDELGLIDKVLHYNMKPSVHAFMLALRYFNYT